MRRQRQLSGCKMLRVLDVHNDQGKELSSSHVKDENLDVLLIPMKVTFMLIDTFPRDKVAYNEDSPNN